MRILLVANTLPPADISGVGEQVVQLAAGLRGLGHSVDILGRGASGAHGPKLLFPLTVGSALRRKLRQASYDVVQVHESDAGLAARWLRRWRGSKRTPLIVALQQVSYVEERRAVRPLGLEKGLVSRPGGKERRFRRFKAPLQVLLGRMTVAAADRVLAPSKATAAEIERDYRVRDVGILPNATTLAELPLEASPEAQGLDGFFLFVGRLRIRKGVEVLLAALARPEAPPIPLLVAGEGEHRVRLQKLARRLGLDDRVHFLGRRSTAQVRGLLGRARALIVPSIYEGMPLVILEAMANSVPVVASAVSGIPEVVEQGRSGWLVAAEDPAGLAAALRQAADPEEARRRGEEGRKIVAERLTAAHVAAHWVREIEAARARFGA